MLLRKTWYSLMAGAIALALAACQPVQVAQEAGPQTIALGVAQPFTGSLGSFGTDFGKGIELAVEQMNAEMEKAGTGVTFQIASAGYRRHARRRGQSGSDRSAIERRGSGCRSSDHQRSAGREAIRG